MIRIVPRDYGQLRNYGFSIFGDIREIRGNPVYNGYIMHIKKNILLCKKKNIKYRKSDYAYQVVNELDGFYFKRIHNFVIY